MRALNLFLVLFMLSLALVRAFTRSDAAVNAEMVELQEANRAWATAYAELEEALETQCVKP